jgi:hypothetical protein
MFDQTPIRERHAAIGVFAAIGLFGAAAFELLITGGFAPLAPSRDHPEIASAPTYAYAMDDRWAEPLIRESDARFMPTRYPVAESEIDVEPAPLAGAVNERREATLERSFADIERDIEALYQQAAPYREAYQPAESFGVTSSDAEQDKKDAAAEIEFSDAGSALPW